MSGNSPLPIVRFEQVSVTYEDTVVLDNVSFEIPEGETRVILGAAGSGKTVMLKTTLGLIRPDSGRVIVFGEDITRLSETDLFDVRARIGILFQEGGLFDSLTIEENVAYPLWNRRNLKFPPEETRRRVEDALRFVELEHTLEKFPSELSGGMRRRVGIARAVVTEPPLVLYDSPTAGLDPITASTILALVIKERDLRNTTTVIVTHRYQDGVWMAEFRYNPKGGRLDPMPRDGHPLGHTKFMVLREGRLVFTGTRAELESSNDPYIVKFIKR